MKRFGTWVLFFLCMWGGQTKALNAAEIATTPEGVSITVPGMPTFTIEYPLKSLKVLNCQVDKEGATLDYEEGTKLRVEVKADGAIDYSFTNFPTALKAVDLWMNLDPGFGDGGTYRLNDEALQGFPKTADPQFFVQKHNARRWALHDREGHNLIFTLPGHTYLQMEDRRAEIPSRYRMIMACPVLPGNPRVTVRVGDLPASAPAAGLQPVSVGRSISAIVIDGKPEDWTGIPIQSIPASRLTEGKTAEGLSATFQLSRDEKKLYLLVSVSDPTPLQNTNVPVNAWSGDAVELFVGGEPLDLTGDLLAHDFQIVFGASAAGIAPFSRDFTGLSEMKSAVRAREGGWILEAAIPFRSLGWNPDSRKEFRFDLGIDESSDGKNRRCQIMWNGTNRNALSRTDWGKAVWAK